MEILIFVLFLLLWLLVLAPPFLLVFLFYCKYVGMSLKFSYRRIIAGFIAWCVIVLLVPLWIFPLIDTPFVLLLGWIVGLWRFFRGFRLEWVALAVGTVSTLLFFASLHFFLRGVRKQYAKMWTFRQTLCVGGIMFAVTLSGIAILAGIHEVYWAVTTDEPWIAGGSEAARRMQSNNNLKQIGLAGHTYHEANKAFSGGTMLDPETPGHSWATLLLPYLEQSALYQEIDLSVPWSAEKNRPCFEKRVYTLRSPKSSDKESSNAEGYALTHYAVNERLLPVGGTISLGDIKDGASNTIFSGEVNGNFRAWGDPVNARDPALGVNKTPYGFGSRFVGGANMGLCDGSVTFVSETIELDVLKAMAEPSDGKGGTL